MMCSISAMITKAMNTGVQRSSATPPAARTATTPVAGPEPGNVFGTGKSLPKIAVAHGIPYVATATVADLHDLERKVSKAMGIRGARYIHVHVPCPLGWGSASHDTIRLARLAVESGLFPVFEAEHGAVTNSRKIRNRVPVVEYLKPQKRFAHLFRDGETDGRIARLQGIADRNIAEFHLAATTEVSDGASLRHYARHRFESREPHRIVAQLSPGLCRSTPALQSRLPGR